MRFSELRRKEVINVRDGMRFGYIGDMEISMKNGCISSFLIPCEGKIMGVWGKEKQYQIDWCQVVRIGQDIILVDVETDQCCREIPSTHKK